MTIVNYDGIISNRSAGNADDRYWFKSTSITPGAIGQWYSLLNSAGFPAAMTWSNTTTTGALMDASNTGAIPITASSTQDAYFLTAGVEVSSASGFAAMMLVDVVWGLSFSTASSPGAVSSFPSLTRYTSGQGLQIMGFATTATSAAVTPTVTYNGINSAGNTVTGHTCALTTPATTVVNQCVPQLYPFATLQSGDVGVTSITNISLGATGTGNFTVALVMPIMVIPTIAATTFVERDSTIQIDGLTKLPRGSDNKFPCLGWMAIAGGTSTCATQQGFIRKVNATT